MRTITDLTPIVLRCPMGFAPLHVEGGWVFVETVAGKDNYFAVLTRAEYLGFHARHGITPKLVPHDFMFGLATPNKTTPKRESLERRPFSWRRFIQNKLKQRTAADLSEMFGMDIAP